MSQLDERTDAPTSLTSRRAFLTRSAGAGSALLLLGAAACAKDDEAPVAEKTGNADDAAALPEGKDPANFILHSPSPLTLETKRAAYGTSAIVPYELLFVRQNLPTPDASIVADRDAWKLEVTGVGAPRTITVGELKTLGVQSVATVLQCSGNGRGYFPHNPSGSKWKVGASGCVIWSGVPVKAVAEALGGVAAGVRFVTGTGGEVLPEGLDPKEAVVERSIPLEKGMEDAILAWEMNGEPLPLVHGGPLRLIVPGFYGVNQIKYIKRLAFTAAESDAEIMESGYRVRDIGQKGNPSQPTMWYMDVKSWVNHPAGDQPVKPGKVVIDGVAFGGAEPVSRVEVSTDGGNSWQEAPFIGPNLGKYAWRQFALPVTLEAGEYTITSRATDTAGKVQSSERTPNERGYGDTSWKDLAVTLKVG